MLHVVLGGMTVLGASWEGGVRVLPLSDGIRWRTLLGVEVSVSSLI